VLKQPRVCFPLLVFWLWAFLVPVRAAIQFDVFLGYDGIVPEASWFPVVCEIKNDGPGFNGTIEVSPANYNQGQVRRAAVELPTGTLKRVSIPVFSTTRGYSTWDVRLLDERGKVRAEQAGVRTRKQLAVEAPLLGAIVRTPTGAPVIEPIRPQQSELQPATARLLPSIFADNPLVLEGMDCLYLNSEKAPDLRSTQVNALYGWLHAGGHLVVGIEQITDVNGTPWLKSLMPIELKGMRALERHTELQDWLRTPERETVTYGRPFVPREAPSYQKRKNQRQPQPEADASVAANPFREAADDFAFETAPMQVATGTLRDGLVLAGTDAAPLMVTAQRGNGRITVLLFSPEREPVRSWKNLGKFWAKISEVPGGWYTSESYQSPGGWSSDGIFGAMLDSRQVHKLPIEWLLVLLLVYLVVIGPLDQYWLKKIGRPMLTWITFPCYVVLFSLLIYFIGYKLRAGESEWNELHIVDLLTNGDKAEMRGRTFASVYSPANQRYLLVGNQKYATLRGEFAGMWGGGQVSDKATVMQTADNFRAEIFVPVWTSQLFVSDWWNEASMPLETTVKAEGDGWRVTLANQSDRKLTSLQLAVGGYLIPLGDLGPKQNRTLTVSKEQGASLQSFATRFASTFVSAVQSRQRAFGATEKGRVDDLAGGAVAASFMSHMAPPPNTGFGGRFICPPGLDLTACVERGNAVVFAWAADYSPVKPMNQFSPRRLHRDTLWRMTTPVL
jgi:hypothetical protein